MPKPLRNLINDRMIQLQNLAIEKGLVETSKEWYEQIGCFPSNTSKYLNYSSGFTDEQKLAAVKLVDANLNWLFGYETNMLRKDPKDAMGMIRAGLQMLESKRK